MHSTIIYGPSGIGKSTIGKLLAEEEQRNYVDTDVVFHEKYGSISTYITKYGVDSFRQIEYDILRESLGKGCVVSLGGGTLLRRESQDLANTQTNLITLMSDVETIVARVLQDSVNHRPLSLSEDMIRILYRERYAHYTGQKIVLNISQSDTPERVVQHIKQLQVGTSGNMPLVSTTPSPVPRSPGVSSRSLGDRCTV